MPDTMTATSMVVGLFDTMEDAHRAAGELRQQGIGSDQISIVAGNEANRYDGYLESTSEPEKDLKGGVGSGLALGGGLGLLAGLAALAIPGFGPLLAVGPIAAALTGATLGAASGGVIGGLMTAGVNESDARIYEDALRSGGVLVSVRSSDEQTAYIAGILDRNGARDIDNTDQPHPDLTGTNRRLASEEHSLPFVEEQIETAKWEVKRRGVRIYPEVHSPSADRNTELREEDIGVKRRAADYPATDTEETNGESVSRVGVVVDEMGSRAADR